jgi:hypothetical protein
MKNIKKIFYLISIILLTFTTNSIAKNTKHLTPNEMKCENKIIIGEKEYVYLPTYKLKMEARIDTGATTTSIDARNVKPFEKDGKKWVKFELYDRKTKKITKVEKPLIKMVSIKRHGAKDQIRYAVKFRINLAGTSQYILVTLADRSKYTFPVLIGRNFLNGVAIVDVTKSFTEEPTKKDK